jgi:glycosyltransferase involved in cell wall biosynthesis
LLVIAPNLGARSETFVRRHMEALLPGGTAVVVRQSRGAGLGHWTPRAPHLALDEVRWSGGSGAVARAYWRLVRQLPPAAGRATERFAAQHGACVVLVEWLDLAVLCLGVARRLGLPLFAHAHGYDASERWLGSRRWRRAYAPLRRAAGIVVVNRLQRERLARLGLPRERIHVIPCGVDVPGFPDGRPPSRQTCGPGSEPAAPVVRVLVVGRLVPKKAPLTVLEAFRRARARVPELRLDIVGDGPLLPAARRYLGDHELGAAVTLHGGLGHAEVLDLMARADVFLQHSVTDPETGDEEGLPVSLLEAMAHALPVVATRHAGIPEAVADGETGLLQAEHDAQGTAEALVTLAHDPTLRARLGCAGWERAGRLFSWEREREALLALLGLRVG